MSGSGCQHWVSATVMGAATLYTCVRSNIGKVARADHRAKVLVGCNLATTLFLVLMVLELVVKNLSCKLWLRNIRTREMPSRRPYTSDTPAAPELSFVLFDCVIKYFN
eukprot:GHUV01029399.1.p3 GENE.GHUV01029399.1~~GHUV01029399.1.p3  ORF type:complete len:108 (+),score=5.34 GHUV01029399.1:2600-2923(+)